MSINFPLFIKHVNLSFQVVSFASMTDLLSFSVQKEIKAIPAKYF